MKIELKPFQETAARGIIEELADARSAVARGKNQAVVLSAPTGSGKTITVAAVIDMLLGGGDGVEARPQTTFLWLSDSPELNTQSANKLLGACDQLPFHRIVTVESDSFDEEHLRPGHLYFINTQLLGTNKRLTGKGDKRDFSFWQTVANTVARSPQDFILIIDEAHRGASASEKTRTPIMQKFIKGSDDDGLPAVPLVLGMSATPQRFTTLLGNTTRTQRPVVITAEDVRSSGLLKDLIIVHSPKTNAPGDWTMLEKAAERWKEFSTLWANYCRTAKEKTTVRPILVVQVEDGNETAISRTNLGELVGVLERQTGALGLNEIVHCFQDQNDLQAGGKIIRKIEPSRIQDSSDVKVVLFKTALSTGWDCPRAEVMMSFRRAKDPTSIAQLVGRMIRTPLARRIDENEVLDTVDLFLPHYDADALEGVLSKLRSPDAEEGVPTRVETETVTYERDPAHAAVFDHLETLPNYAINRVPKMGNIKRVLRLAGLLVHEGIDLDADESAREKLTAKLRSLRDEYAKDKKWGDVVRDGGSMDVDVLAIEVGGMQVTQRSDARLTLSEENIDQLFDATGRALAASEGLHRSYWKRYHDHDDPNAAKLELFAIVRNAKTVPALDTLAGKMFDDLMATHRPAIKKLPPAERERFERLSQATGAPAKREWELPTNLVEKKAGDTWKGHLYIDAGGSFLADLNSWEREILEEQMAQADFVGWLRNIPRRDWAMCIPYDQAGVKPFYPDFVIVRRHGDNYVVDIVEPHDDSRVDTWAKAKGLAEFADKYGMDFGRLIIARKKGGEMQMADVNVRKTREAARLMQSPNDLDSLFRA